ncbi:MULTISPECIES: PadR family transcriptional regulator [Pseudovibrio]|uniref:PadR family transcriptional regulator n=1 Tax=Stappiaceae TaxID=2821832 RepID=UPI0023659EED|nr:MULTISPECIES: PadR family transcriptional regulator [Pseudovibrio]MDD7908953.1 PadR family transcriptional regulator [Pseudovibrio exalbescens]MDX5593726.1 PadR family transcriptional regulator [Pseudovibrio sp. SPO723]
MSTRKFCLSILMKGETTGYDLRKRSKDGLHRYFTDASYGSIYPCLNKLEAEGLVTSREETAPGKPSRKVYTITDKGRLAFCEELQQPPYDDTYRSPFLFTALHAAHLSPEFLSGRIDMRIEELQNRISALEAELEVCTHPAGCWTLRMGIATLTAGLKYIEDNRSELEALPQASSQTPAQAAE